MKQYLIPESGHFYKANMHCHTTCSDGRLTPTEIKEHYKAQGYSVVAYTDHEVMVDHSDLNDGEFLAITGYELETHNGANAPFGLGEAGPNYHLNFYAAKPDETDYPFPNPDYAWGNARAIADTQAYYRGDYIRKYSVEGQNELIAEARAKGYRVSFNHPDWSLQNYNGYIGLEGITAVEVYNTGCALGGWIQDEGHHALDDYLKVGKRVYPVAADDNHGTRGMCGGWIRLKAPELSYDAIMNAYDQGDFYASWGPDLDALYFEDGFVKVDVPAEAHVVRAIVHTGIRRSYSRFGEDMTHIEFDLNGYLNLIRDSRYPASLAYFRVELIDNRGRKAMTRGYFLDELQ